MKKDSESLSDLQEVTHVVSGFELKFHSICNILGTTLPRVCFTLANHLGERKDRRLYTPPGRDVIHPAYYLIPLPRTIPRA